MLTVIRLILSGITLLLAGYGLITQDFSYIDFMILFLGLSMLASGLVEFKKGQKGNGWLFVVVFLFCTFVSIKGFFFQ
ncbi:DUF3953 domain-containing protein [Ornithinibacillus californiensis]|uniref:DUF3953 domain-containing protein n=1 Tax=Ornithinibacillus californiensis TaxID=161536 RepID=UPI00064DF12D|nr:DUF3953 domain-containing protein [Ornithinibacillus californiensis]